MLERATHLSDELGGGSLTALPIVETEAQNIAAYIPTNLISITDGQIYLSPTQFELGILPAIDIGKSVSRVGDKAQLPIYQTATAGLKLNHSQFVELENFARFGTRLDSRTQKVLDHGQRIREVLKQSNLAPIPVTEQILTLLALKQGLLDAIPLEQIAAAERTLATTAGQLTKSELEAIRGDQVPDDRLIAQLIQHCEAALAEFKP